MWEGGRVMCGRVMCGRVKGDVWEGDGDDYDDFGFCLGFAQW